MLSHFSQLYLEMTIARIITMTYVITYISIRIKNDQVPDHKVDKTAISNLITIVKSTDGTCIQI